MADDLKLSSNEYSIALVVFFVTYVAFEPGSNMILVRWKPSLYLPTIMAIWGCLTCTMAAINHFHHLVALRIFVGVFEAGFGKTCSDLARSLTANWYQPQVSCSSSHHGTNATSSPNGSVYICRRPFCPDVSVVSLLVLSLEAWRVQVGCADGDGKLLLYSVKCMDD
jgi:MFS family permease